METEENILSLIPQQPPFVMIDRLYYSDDSVTRSGFRVTAENVLTDNGVFTEAGLLENIAQTAAAREGYLSRAENKPVRVGYIASVKNFDVFMLPAIGSELQTEVTVEDTVMGVLLLSGRVWCQDTLLAQCEMKVFLS